MHDAWAGLRGWRVGTFGWRRNQRLYELMSEAHDLVRTHVAADHALGQSRLKRLIHDAAIILEVCCAARHERVERDILRHAAATRLEHAGDRVASRRGQEFHFPNALTAIAAVP